MMDLYKALVEIVTALDGAGIEAALVGGLAYSLYVEPRATDDLDLLIRPEDWDRCVAALKPLGWAALAGPMDFANIRIRRLTRISEASVCVCDFLLADGDLIEGLTRSKSFTIDGRSLRLAPPDVIVDLKKRRNSPKDQGDIAGLEKYLEGT